MINPLIKNLRLIAYIFILLASIINAQSLKVKLIETSDVHGALLPYDLVNDTTMNSSIAQVFSYVNTQRNIEDQIVILLDNGDILQGDPLVYYYNYEDTTSVHICAKVMNYMNYDAGTVGNHDIETGHKVYDKFRKELNFPWLAANAIDIKTGDPYFEPYTIIERRGIKIAVLGLITPYIPQWLPENIWTGIEFEDMVVSSKKWVKIIKEKETPDLLIGLFHSGVDYTYGGETKDTYRNENASRLVAEQVPGLDVVFVGHDHQLWNFYTVNSDGDSVLILGPRARAKNICIATISLSCDSLHNIWKKTSVTGEAIEVSDYKPNELFVSKFENNFTAVRNYVSKPLGIFTKSMLSKESIFGPSEFVDLIQTFQLETTGADISFVSPLSFNVEIDSGWVYVRDMFKLYRYENFLYTMRLSGQEIKDYLEYSYAGWFNQMKNEDDHLLKFKTNDEGNLIYSEPGSSPTLFRTYYNFSSAAGIDYTVDVTKLPGECVNIQSLSNGSPFDLSKYYKVAINSYRGSGGGGHLIKGPGISKEELSKRIISSTDKDLRYYMMKWIVHKKNIYPKLLGNWSIIPKKFWKRGKVRDYKLLFK